jgi:hypothetical protein
MIYSALLRLGEMNGSQNKSREHINKDFCLHTFSKIGQAKTRCG